MSFKQYFSLGSYQPFFLRWIPISGILFFILISDLSYAKADIRLSSECSNLQNPKVDAWRTLQDTTKKSTIKQDTTNKIFVSVEQQPQYPGGELALLQDLGFYLQGHHPPKAKRKNISGKGYSELRS